MDQDEPKGLAAELTRPVGFGISMVAATFLCAILAAAILIVSTLHWPVLREHGDWQLAIFAGSALLLGVIVFPAARRLDARAAARRRARGTPPKPTGVPTSSLVLGMLLFGAMGAGLLWVFVAGRSNNGLDGLGLAVFSLTIASVCAGLLWRRFRRR
ncbi:hypothetical protein GCM10022229_01370 [Luteimonas lutimaris]|uniref:MFS transporter n=2 Tax=Luteimonas lutimaris TaxID=698645 RepID=A0ABP7M5D0_9GAMM